MSGRGGRRPGESGTRDAILEAARRRFAQHGFRAATIRAIAGDAEVDPALVHHYFGTKRELFRAAVRMPIHPGELVGRLLAEDPDDMGEQIVRVFLGAWDHGADTTPMFALLRSAVADEQAAAMIREFVAEVLLGPVVARLGGDDRARLRAGLVSSQLIGLAVLRYIVRLEPLASADPDELAVTVGATLQRYLVGDLG